MNGSSKVYAFICITVCCIAYAAYYMLQVSQVDTRISKENYQEFYTEQADGVYSFGSGANDSTSNVGSSQRDSRQGVNGGVGSVYGGYGSASDSGSDTVTRSAPRTVPYSDVPTKTRSGASPDTDSRTIPSTGTSPDPTIDSVESSNTDSGTYSNTTPETQYPEKKFITFQSKINKKLSFSVPETAKVTEEGIRDLLLIHITDAYMWNGSIRKDEYDFLFNKNDEQCQDILYAQAIDPASGIDYRIIHDQRQIALDNTYRALRAHEEFGSHDYPSQAIRTVGCIFTPIPTQIKIMTNSFVKEEFPRGFEIMETIFKSITP